MIFVSTIALFVSLIATVAIGFMGSDRLGRVLGWAFGIFSGDNLGTLKQLLAMPIPDLSEKTFVGTGAVVSESGNASGHDSGYVQTYFAVGLPVAVVFYVSVFFNFSVEAARSAVRFPFYLLLIATILAELKEPFIFKYTSYFFLVLLASVSLVGPRNCQVPDDYALVE
jgi:hypothetical protein